MKKQKINAKNYSNSPANVYDAIPLTKNKKIEIKGGFFENRILTVEEVAIFLGFAPQTIKNWVAQRKIPFIRIGRKTRFCPKSLRAWLKRKEFESCQ